MRNFSLLILLAGSLFLSGCTNSWLVGKWEVDKEATMAAFEASQGGGKESAEGGGGGFLGDILSGVQKGISRVLVAAMEDTTVEFTATEFRKLHNGSGVFQTYEVIERPAAGVAVVKFSDGELVTWAKSGSGIKRKLPGDHDLWIYFKKAL